MRCLECKRIRDERVYDELFDNPENCRQYGDPVECIVCGQLMKEKDETSA